YDTVNSPQLENMTLTQLSKYKLIVWPGGDSLVQNSNLDKATKQRVHDAVVKNGVSYVGFCAGTFIAVAPSQPAQGGWGLGIVTAAYVPVYPAVPNPSESTAAMVWTTYANGTKRDLVWWDGPVAPNLSNGIISKYPSG